MRYDTFYPVSSNFPLFDHCFLVSFLMYFYHFITYFALCPLIQYKELPHISSYNIT